MKVINNIDPMQGNKKSYMGHYLLTVLVAIAFFFIMAFLFGILKQLLILIKENWPWAIGVVVIILFIKMKFGRRNTTYEYPPR